MQGVKRQGAGQVATHQALVRHHLAHREGQPGHTPATTRITQDATMLAMPPRGGTACGTPRRSGLRYQEEVRPADYQRRYAPAVPSPKHGSKLPQPDSPTYVLPLLSHGTGFRRYGQGVTYMSVTASGRPSGMAITRTVICRHRIEKQGRGAECRHPIEQTSAP